MKYILEESTGFIINRTHQKLSNYLTRKFKPYDITPEQWEILNRLWQNDGISQKEISEITLKDQTTLTRILDKLEHKGLIKRQVSPSDRRVFLIFLTDKGRDLEDILVSIAYEVSGEVLQGLSQEEIKQLKALLNRIFANVKQCKT
ncbi:MarR family transcriptional regulator [Desulfosporosinus sp. PR]|uniref:MarR family winged helix-turn-helix transcriptional regulator n=1 Tax=Candidatus Desulfosporosinus nitrosoreducens TaxID=3401928 RepID=UPI0027FA974B|nr:MarR family transcriptional regulator [Desulfosporosinus sp. PR]MDQ7097121.1 MarR family transcriptional regulator [Desulfosporosinus sp. PR]